MTLQLPIRRGHFLRRDDGVWQVHLLKDRVIHLLRHDTGETDRISLDDWRVGCFNGTIEMVDDPDKELEESRRELLSIPVSDMNPLMAYTAVKKGFFTTAFRDPDAFYDRYYPGLPHDQRISPINRSKACMRVFGPVVADAWSKAHEERYRQIFGGRLPKGFHSHPGPTAWCDWLDLHRRVRGNERGLASRFDQRGRTHRELDPMVLEWLDETIDFVWLTSNKRTMLEVSETLSSRVDAWNDANPDALEPLVAPSVRHVQRYIKETVDQRTACYMREGEKEAEKRYGQFGLGPRADYILEVLEVDHTRCDIEVLDDRTGAKMGRPWISVALDRHSRMVVGMHISFEGPSIGTVMQVLKSAMSPKPFLKDYGIDFDYPWGVPTSFFFDLGTDFDNDSVRESCAAVDVRVDYEPAKHPEYKGKVERFWRTLQHKAVHRLPGAMPPIKEGDFARDENGEAHVTFDAFVRYVWYWIAMVYAKRPHRGVDMKMASPLNKWRESESVRLPRPVCKKHDLDILFTRVVELTPDKSGVKWEHAAWTGDALTMIMSRPGFPKSGTVKVRIDDEDLGRAWVVDPISCRSYALDPVDPYLHGMSLYRHKNNIRFLKERNVRRINFRQLRDADVDLMAEASQIAAANGRRGRSIPAVARHLGVGKPKGAAPAEIPDLPETEPQAPAPRKAAYKVKEVRGRAKKTHAEKDDADE